jgi:hypothetical protein
MKRFLGLFGSKRSTSATNRVRVRPRVEALEERSLPTVLFLPHFAHTHVTSNSGAYQSSKSGESIAVLFAGSYWQTAQGQQDQQTLTNDVQTLLGSPYLTGLAQYEPGGTITLPSLYATADDSTPIALKNDFPTNRAQNHYFVDELLAHPNLIPPATSNPQQQPIYVVFNDPGDSGDGQADYGMNWYDNAGNQAIYVATLVGSGGGVWIDQATDTFSHELAEATASAVSVSDPGRLREGSQICDNEPESGTFGYTARVDGVLVQAYWSQQDLAWIVPDGNSPNTVLRPIWSRRSFTGTYQNLTTTASVAQDTDRGTGSVSGGINARHPFAAADPSDPDETDRLGPVFGRML